MSPSRSRTTRWVLGGAAALSLTGACATSTPERPVPVTAAAPQPVYGTFGFDLEGMDRSVEPGDDFYGYANGGWHQRTEIPPDRTRTGSFVVLADEAARRTRALVEEAAAAPDARGDIKKLADYYASFMDQAAIESKGLTPLQPELARLAAMKTRAQLSRELGATLRADVDALNMGDVETEQLFGLWVSEDLNDPSRYTAYLLQGGLGMPDRDYYLVENPRFTALRDKYQLHIAAMLKLAGMSGADARAVGILELEKKIAQAHWAQVDTREVSKANNPWLRADFAQRAPGMDWEAYFGAAGLGAQQDFIVWQPSALTAVSHLVGSGSLETWKDYLALRALERAAQFLPQAFASQHFAFHQKELAGAEQERDRWKRGVEYTDDALGEVIGRLYVEKYFPKEAKAAADAMVKNIVRALGQRIDALEWMTPATREKAREKLATLQVGIGHPAKWRDYSGLEVVRGDAWGNRERASRFELARNLAKLGRPVDRQEWFMTPQLVNALNSPQQNSIIFPAAILQPPFFDPHADPAVNYGGIGSVIGHEIIHSFDDMGALFDARGKLANWWTAEDAARFQAAGEALVAQYNTYRPFPDAAVNGALTLGENIADAAGIAIAHDGYKLGLGGRPAPVLDGFSGEQRFFLGFAQVWRNKYREPTLRRSLLTDGHAPGQYRALTVRNQDAWYTAFEVQPGDALYLKPEQRVRVW
ncbi:MAG: M13 family metallopeptidase [Myxococcota bacterium]|nr:M13 family metallopeptidase [Myxococcota bacterium]